MTLRSPLLRSLSLFALLSLAGLVGLAGCDDPPAGTDAGPPPVDAGPQDAGPMGHPDPLPVERCPGSDGCADEGDDVLYAGAAAIDITADVAGAEHLTVDMDGDGMYDADQGDQFEDLDGDGYFDGVWIAGFGNGRPAAGVMNQQWARAIALRQNETTIVMISLDVVGWFIDDADHIRERAADVDADFITVSATHVHEAADTIGIWGPTFTLNGQDLEYMDQVYTAAAEAARQAVANLEVAHIRYAHFDLRDKRDGTLNFIGDNRDPNVLDDRVRLMQFVQPGGATIATLVNFAAHPEYQGSRNLLLSSDFAHWLREGIESGVDGPDGARLEGVGGVAVFINGAVGSQIGPNHIRPTAWDGTPLPESTPEEAAVMTEAVGSQIAYFALEALGDSAGVVEDETADLGFRTQRFFVQVQNTYYQLAFSLGLFRREVFHYDMSTPINPRNQPYVMSEVSILDIGRVQVFTVPGELDPLLWLGGYDGSYTPVGQNLVEPDNEHPPNLDAAPEGPYLRDLARADAEDAWCFGLTNDFVGYLVPEFDYILSETGPYVDEAPGEHYEETNSIGIDGWPTIRDRIHALAADAP